MRFVIFSFQLYPGREHLNFWLNQGKKNSLNSQLSGFPGTKASPRPSEQRQEGYIGNTRLIYGWLYIYMSYIYIVVLIRICMRIYNYIVRERERIYGT